VVKLISNTLLEVGGANGFSDIPQELISKITGGNGEENPSENTDNGNSAQPANNTPAVTPTNTSTGTIPSGTAANNPKTTGDVSTGIYVSVAAFAAFSALATYKLKKKKEE
jgi:hypothetical protein